MNSVFLVPDVILSFRRCKYTYAAEKVFGVCIWQTKSLHFKRVAFAFESWSVSVVEQSINPEVNLSSPRTSLWTLYSRLEVVMMCFCSLEITGSKDTHPAVKGHASDLTLHVTEANSNSARGIMEYLHCLIGEFVEEANSNHCETIKELA